MVTLAAWNDSEYATGTLQAGTFGIQGSPTGTEPFNSSSTEAPHTLEFSFEGALYPGTTTYSLFSVRTEEDSLGGNVQLLADEGNAEDLGAALTYGVATVEEPSCNADTFEAGTQIIDRGSGLTAGAETSQELAPDQGAPVNYCLEVTLPTDAPNEAQGSSASPSWQFLGTSDSQ